MGRKNYKLEDLRVGSTVEIAFTAKISEIDLEDRSIRIQATDGQYAQWFWPERFEDTKIREPKVPLIPGDAVAISYVGLNEMLFFLTKNELGAWTDIDGERYTSTEALTSTIKTYGKPETVTVYDKRGA